MWCENDETGSFLVPTEPRGQSCPGMFAYLMYDFHDRVVFIAKKGSSLVYSSVTNSFFQKRNLVILRQKFLAQNKRALTVRQNIYISISPQILFKKIMIKISEKNSQKIKVMIMSPNTIPALLVLYLLASSIHHIID